MEKRESTIYIKVDTGCTQSVEALLHMLHAMNERGVLSEIALLCSESNFRH